MLYENYKHSASAGNLWFENQSAFIWRYGFRNWGKDNPRANMGKAAEQAVFRAIEVGATISDIPTYSDMGTAIFDKMQSGEVHEERDAVGPIVGKMLGCLIPMGGTFTRKPREARMVSGLGKRVNFEVDLFHSERGIIDLKSTLRMAWGDGKDPAPHWGHVRQQGLYRRLEGGTPVSLLYATPKRVELYEIPAPDAERGADELMAVFHQIELWEQTFPSPEQALRYIPLNTESFYWDDETDVEAARKLWSTHRQQAA